MTRSTRALLLGLWTLAAALFAVPAAGAYVDGGSMSVVFQAIIAGIAAAGTGFAMFRQKIVAFFKRGPKGEAGGTETSAEAPAATDA